MRFVKGFLMVVGAGAVILAALWLVTDHEDQPTPLEANSVSAGPTPIPSLETKPYKGCILKGGAGAVCSSGLAAVIAYQRYGDDTQIMRQSYAKTVLHQAGCFVITNDGPAIQQMSHGRVALSDGWVGVTTVSVGPGGGVIADAFLEGVCERYKVVETVSPPVSNAPDFRLPADGRANGVEATGGTATLPPSDRDDSGSPNGDNSPR